MPSAYLQIPNDQIVLLVQLGVSSAKAELTIGAALFDAVSDSGAETWVLTVSGKPFNDTADTGTVTWPLQGSAPCLAPDAGNEAVAGIDVDA